MKILLTRDADASRPGFAAIGREFDDLDKFVEDAEATEIVADDVIDFVADRGGAARHWAGKLRRGGTIAVSGLDLHSACRSFGRRILDAGAASKLLYSGRSSASTAGDTAAMLGGLGLAVESSRIVHHHYCVTARRP